MRGIKHYWLTFLRDVLQGFAPKPDYEEPDMRKPPSPIQRRRGLYIGARLRQRRIELGLTQADLSDKIGVTYQQEYKYERGINRISAERLYQIAECLGVPITYFYEGITDETKVSEGPHNRLRLAIGRDLAMVSNPDHLAAIGAVVREFSIA
jgi:transcriptional regulator with XRE-family HTH domain